MNVDAIKAQLVTANRLRCISLQNRQRYRLRIEDMHGAALSEFVDLPVRETQKAVQLSTLLPVAGKENLIVLEGGDEDYRLPIVDEDTLRAQLYPK